MLFSMKLTQLTVSVALFHFPLLVTLRSNTLSIMRKNENLDHCFFKAKPFASPRSESESSKDQIQCTSP